MPAGIHTFVRVGGPVAKQIGVCYCARGKSRWLRGQLTHFRNHLTYTVQLTWTDYPKYRFWRKNVSHKEGTSCFGVDLNRNFDVNWSQVFRAALFLLLDHP